MPLLGPPPGIGRQIDENYNTPPFSIGPSGGAIRPTYLKNGVAVNLLFDPAHKPSSFHKHTLDGSAISISSN